MIKIIYIIKKISNDLLVIVIFLIVKLFQMIKGTRVLQLLKGIIVLVFLLGSVGLTGCGLMYNSDN